MTAVVSPAPALYFPNNNNTGAPAAGFKLFTYVAGTSTKQATWTDSTQGVANQNPLPLDANGFASASSAASLWLDPTLIYKFVWAPANDTDPPTSPLRTIDNIRGPLDLATLTQSLIGLLLYPRTTAEIAASVTPVNYAIPSHDAIGFLVLERYATNTAPGTTDMSAALQSAVNIALSSLLVGKQGIPIRCLNGAYLITTPPTFGSVTTAMLPIDIGGEGLGTQIINNAAAGTPTFNMTGRNGWYLHDMVLTGTSVKKNDGIWANTTGGGKAIRWRIERVVSLMAGRGIVTTDTNSGVIRDFRHWPDNPPALAVAQAVTVSDIDHGIYLTGGFAHDVSIYDGDCCPNQNFKAGARGIKLDAASATSIRIFGGLYQTGSGANTETGIDLQPSGSGSNLLVMNPYVEGTAVVLGNVLNSTVTFTNGGVATSLTLNSGTRNNLFFGVTVATLNDASSGNYGNTFIGCSVTTTWTDSTGTATDPPDRRINCLQAGALINDYGGGQSFNITYSASMTPDTFNGLHQRIVATNGTAFTLNAPLHPIIGQRLRLQIYNASGGALGAVTFNAVFKLSAWTQPANGFNRSIQFYFDSSFWCQVSQTGVDVPT